MMEERESRRDFLKMGCGMALGLSSAWGQGPRSGGEGGAGGERAFSIQGHRVRLSHPGVREGFRLVMVADTHLSRDDERGEPFRKYSGRMAAAYRETRHFESGRATHPEEGLSDALEEAKRVKAAMVVLAGDLLSFPSEAAVEWLVERLQASGIPWIYTAGNHDWHYEGMEGSLEELRRKWVKERLGALYRGREPMMSVDVVQGVKLVAIDNSTYEISEAQLEFFREQLRDGAPVVVFLHIPLYAPGRGMGYGCGHPQWGAAVDRSFEIERRPRWPEGGHTAVTMAFRREVFGASQVLGVFAGHTHQAAVDVVNGVPQCVAAANAAGGYLCLDLAGKE